LQDGLHDFQQMTLPGIGQINGGAAIMANDFEIKTLDRDRGASAHQHGADERQHRREQRLRALLSALQAGPIDAARMAFTALVSHDLELAHHPSLARIGSALQSSNLVAALRAAQEMQMGPAPAFKHATMQLRVSDPAHAKPPEHKGFIGGLTGRLFDLSA
jgi:hypothetical protein